MLAKRSGDPLILMYHSVDTYAEDPYQVTVSPPRFREQLRWLRRNGFRGVSVAELLAQWDRPGSHHLVGLTFDDGYADFASDVVPALREHDFTATVFVLGERMGSENEWDDLGPRKQLMTRKQVQQVAEAGMEIGSHGLCHVSLPSASTKVVTEETERSRCMLEEVVGQPVHGFAYPYGEVAGREVEAVRAAGYDYGCAIWRSELTGRHALPRVYIGERDRALRLRAKHLRHEVAGRRRIR